ncbi:MAG TPA: DsbA family oxidoreductase [Polyangiaceae bacterium]|nr:DsbA family oxidoreductase [Polyangiaceae bacterium]
MTALHIDIWSDIACPWCYVGKRRLEAALGDLPERETVRIRWRAFELNPTAARQTETGPYAERLAKKYGTSLDEAQSRLGRLVELAQADGLRLDFERIRPGNTFDAHRIVHLAAERGLQDAVKERFLRGYLSEGEAIGEPEVLVRLAAEAGLAAEEVRSVLASGAHADAVRADERIAQELGIRGVPFFVLGERYAVSGAQPVALFASALRRTLDELAQGTAPFEEGAACGPDGC